MDVNSTSSGGRVRKLHVPESILPVSTQPAAPLAPPRAFAGSPGGGDHRRRGVSRRQEDRAGERKGQRRGGGRSRDSRGSSARLTRDRGPGRRCSSCTRCSRTSQVRTRQLGCCLEVSARHSNRPGLGRKVDPKHSPASRPYTVKTSNCSWHILSCCSPLFAPPPTRRPRAAPVTSRTARAASRAAASASRAKRAADGRRPAPPGTAPHPPRTRTCGGGQERGRGRSDTRVQ